VNEKGIDMPRREKEKLYEEHALVSMICSKPRHVLTYNFLFFLLSLSCDLRVEIGGKRLEC
jgi:hypothetical protein